MVSSTWDRKKGDFEMTIFYWSFLRPLDPQIPHSTKKGFPESSFQYLGFSVGNGKKSLENALTVSIGFHCLFVNFLPMISFMHRAENCVRAATQKWEFSGLVEGGRKRVCELLGDMTHCTMKIIMFSSVVIIAWSWSRPVIKTV